MKIETKNIVSITEANQNFSKVAREVEKNGKVWIFKQNKPEFVVIKAEDENFLNLTDNEKIEIVCKRILKQNLNAFKRLAE